MAISASPPVSSLSPAPAPHPHPHASVLDLGVGIGIGVFFFLLLAFLVITQSLRKFNWRSLRTPFLRTLCCQPKVRDEEDPYSDAELKLAELQLPSRYTYKELAIATKGFSPKQLLGSGGFGEVFKGQLPQDGSTVAVKRMFEQSVQGQRQFLAEMAIIGRISHRHLLPLKGWCYDKGKMLLVYEFMANRGLDGHLLGQPEKTLLWPHRCEILKGVAEGLFYLHEGWEKRIIHNDVKPSNVLLHEDFSPRLADFGLARLIEDSHVAKTVTLAGTPGYVAPELHYTGKANEKSDVYSFGILLLTVGCGRPPLDESLPDEEILLNWVWRLQEEGRLMDAADPRLGGDFSETEMGCVLQLGLICCYPDPEGRPSIRRCLQVLHGDAPLPRLAISKPLLFQPVQPPLQHGDFDQSGNSSFSSGKFRFSESSTNPMLSRNRSCEICSTD